jgi:RNA polymerase sigma factor (sigma-70 family)
VREQGLPPFQSLLDEHATGLHRYLVAAVGPHDAADCFQETMIAALRAYPTLRHADNLIGWLFTIAHRKVIDAARATTRRAVPVGDVPEQPVAREPDILDRDGELWSLVRGLPPKQRSAVVLRHVEDWSYPEIAAVLESSEDAARQSVRVGLARLRQILAGSRNGRDALADVEDFEREVVG